MTIPFAERVSSNGEILTLYEMRPNGDGFMTRSAAWRGYQVRSPQRDYTIARVLGLEEDDDAAKWLRSKLGR